jgi:hypothetical protein
MAATAHILLRQAPASVGVDRAAVTVLVQERGAARPESGVHRVLKCLRINLSLIGS